jgi:hypothetical protein
MERIYATLENVNLTEEQLPSSVKNKINRIEIMTDKYNSKCDLLEEIEDEESDKYKKLDEECDELDGEIDELEEEIVNDIKQIATGSVPAFASAQNGYVAANGGQIKSEKKKNDGFWILAGIVAAVTLGTVMLKSE